MYGLWGYLSKAKALALINVRRVLEGGWYLNQSLVSSVVQAMLGFTWQNLSLLPCCCGTCASSSSLGLKELICGSWVESATCRGWGSVEGTSCVELANDSSSWLNTGDQLPSSGSRLHDSKVGAFCWVSVTSGLTSWTAYGSWNVGDDQ